LHARTDPSSSDIFQMPPYFGRILRTETVMLTASNSPNYHGPGSIKSKKCGVDVSNSGYNDAYEKMRGSSGTFNEEGLLPESIKVINVVIKMRSQISVGIPEIGIVLSPSTTKWSKSKVCTIKQIQKNSPAQKCGSIRAGDVIHKINSVEVADKSPEEVIAMLRKAAIDSKWTYGPLRLQLFRNQSLDGGDAADNDLNKEANQGKLMNLMTIAIKKNSKMVASKKPNPIRLTLLQRTFCDRLDKALSEFGYYDAIYHL